MQDGYPDWELDGSSPTETMLYLAGVFQMVPGGTPEYYHGNQIGTTRLMTGFGDPWPVVTREAVNTAFGELKWTETGSTATRYGYAGAHGYEEGLMPRYLSWNTFPYLHVGARWYDPLTGRFLQRDPIGIAGGANVYEYGDGNPVALADPSGLWPRGGLETDAVYKGIRRQGYSPSEASQIVAEGTKTELAAAGVMTGAVACVAVGYSAVTTLGGALAGGGSLSLGTSDPGFVRWGQGVISKAGEVFQTGWRIAIGGPRGGWPFHAHIHRNNWWAPWRWVQRCK